MIRTTVATPFVAALLASTGLALALALLAWRRSVRGHTAFVLLMLAVAEWSALSALELAASDRATKIICAKLEYIGIGAVPPLWLLFTLAYEGSGTPSRRVRAMLWVIPILTLGLALTNEYHGLIWSHISAPAPGAPLVYHHGPWFWVAVAYAYLLVLSGSVVLLWTSVRAAPAYRGQAALLLAAVAAPWLGNLAYLWGAVPLHGLDPTPLAFTLSGLLVGADLLRFGLLDLMPIARATVVEQLGDGVVVVDAQGRLVDLNPAARRLLGAAEGAWIGLDVREAFGGVPALAALWDTHVRGAGAPAAAVAHELAAPGSVWLDVQIVPLQAREGRPTGQVVVLRDITAHKHAADRAQQLAHEQEARRHAEAALRVRAEVLATVAHDLRSPLGTIKGLAQLLQRQVAGAEAGAAPALMEKLGHIDAAATRMARLIDELLDVARLEAGQPLTLVRRPTDLVALVQQAVAEHQARSPAHDLRVEARQAELVGLWDAFRLDRVLDNLLGNAVKYSPPGRPICVRVWHEQDDAVVEVVDRGVGIPAAALPHLFERFHRASNVGATPGTGLGLVGVRRIVEEHGGEIAIHSREGEGTTVIIRLPRGPAEAGTRHEQSQGVGDAR